MKKTANISSLISELSSEPSVQQLLSLIHSLSERLAAQDKKIEE